MPVAPLGPLDEETGARIAAWARGDKPAAFAAEITAALAGVSTALTQRPGWANAPWGMAAWGNAPASQQPGLPMEGPP